MERSDDALEPKARALLESLDQARTLEEYHRAIRAAGRASTTAAMLRTQRLLKTFGGTVPDAGNGVLSWSPTHLLVSRGDLRHARLVPRPSDETRNGSPLEQKLRTPAWGVEVAEPIDDGPRDSRGSDPAEVLTALHRAFAAADIDLLKATIQRRSDGGARVRVTTGTTRRNFHLTVQSWDRAPAAIAHTIVRAMKDES